eukprot:scaffold502806_cov37-Prasinocladus_malaysianus.AAC.2
MDYMLDMMIARQYMLTALLLQTMPLIPLPRLWIVPDTYPKTLKDVIETLSNPHQRICAMVDYRIV